MEYKIDIYKNSKDNDLRFVLGKNGKNSLVVIGLNPSTANEDKADRTMSKVMGFAEGGGYDSFIMLNLYPQRSTDKNQMDIVLNENYHQANLQAIEEILIGKESINILAAFGNDIKLRKYLTQCFKDIVAIVDKSSPNWLKIGELTKSGHPRHPLYSGYNLGLQKMDLSKYLLELK